MDEPLVEILNVVIDNVDKESLLEHLYDKLDSDDVYELARELSENSNDLTDIVSLIYNNHFEQFIGKLIDENDELDIAEVIDKIAKTNKSYIFIEEAGIINKMKYECLKENIENISLNDLEKIVNK